MSSCFRPWTSGGGCFWWPSRPQKRKTHWRLYVAGLMNRRVGEGAYPATGDQVSSPVTTFASGSSWSYSPAGVPFFPTTCSVSTAMLSVTAVSNSRRRLTLPPKTLSRRRRSCLDARTCRAGAPRRMEKGGARAWTPAIVACDVLISLHRVSPELLRQGLRSECMTGPWTWPSRPHKAPGLSRSQPELLRQARGVEQ